MRTDILELTYKGEKHSINEWANILGVHKITLYKRLERFDNVEEILSVKSLKSHKEVNYRKFICPICKKEGNEYVDGMCRNCYAVKSRGYERVFCSVCGEMFNNSKNNKGMCLSCRTRLKPVALATKRMYKNYIDNIVKEEHKPIIKLLNKGFSMAEIGKEVGISRQRVHQIVSKYKKA